MNRLHRFGNVRWFGGVALTAGFIVSMLAGPARAEERKFVVMLAHSPKAAALMPEDEENPIVLPNFADVWDAYFDRVKDTGASEVDSFAEYWLEISYGNVSVSGDAVGWVEVPWPILPTYLFGESGEGEPPGSIDGLVLPFYDLNNSGTLNSFQGEEVPLTQDQMIFIDYNGHQDGTATPGYPPTAEAPTQGLVDFHPLTGQPVWTPGERFRDLDGDGQYDALLEPTRDGWGYVVPDCCHPHSGGGCADDDCELDVCDVMSSCCDQEGEEPIPGEWTQDCADLAVAICLVPDSDPPLSICEDCEQDGDIQNEEFCDTDQDNAWDFPEPFEDFLIIYDPDSNGWVKLDPSPKNLNPRSRAWAEVYIRANYPGFVGSIVSAADVNDGSGFLGRFGNGVYDGPDRWLESGSAAFPNAGSKLQQRRGGQMWVYGATTPRPDLDANYPWSYKDWWEAFWNDKRTQAGLAPETPPLPPTWDERIPQLVEFDPTNPGMLPDPPSGTDDPRPFAANTGGPKARVDQTCGPDEDGLPCVPPPPPPGLDDCPPWLEPSGERCTPVCEPTPPELTDGCTLPALEPWSRGDGGGTQFIDISNGNVLPDLLDENTDGLPDYYDGPAEWDDLPSSIYHARNTSGLGWLTGGGSVSLFGGSASFGNGGDGRPGEVTSTTNTATYGEDIGTGDGGPGGPDGTIPAAGPLAYNIHGANGYDGGNVLNLEFLTWYKTPFSGLSGLASAGGSLYGADQGANQLVSINSAGPSWTAVGGRFDGDEGDGIEILVTVLASHGDSEKLYGTGTYHDPAELPIPWPALFEVSATTGEATFIAYLASVAVPADMAYDPVAGTLYAIFNGSDDTTFLRAIDTATGQITSVVRLGQLTIGCMGLAFAAPDLYTIDNAFDWAARIDLSIDPTDPDAPYTLNLDPLDPEALPFGFAVQAMTFTTDGANWYATDETDHFISIDAASGAASDEGSLGFASARSHILRRDFNLDGLLDMGETREPNTENYAIDASGGTPEDGGPSSHYPFNRRRLTEDAVAALDPSVDWDLWAMPVGDKKYLFSTVLLPGGLYPDGLAAGGRGLFQLPAPGMDLPIQTRDLPEQFPAILFSDFTTGLAGASETGEQLDEGSYAKGLMAHEFLHVWEGYPDLYDYDEYIGGIINRPVGIWDIMSGAFVHPSPPLKERNLGVGRFDMAHAPWLQTNDLTEVIDPFEETDVVLTDYAFDPTSSTYYFENANAPGELFYFWRMTRVDPPNPNDVNFNKILPPAYDGPDAGDPDGFMIMHTDFQTNPEGLPLQQRFGSHFTYNIIQADGLQQLEAGENGGDGGDPWPGNLGMTEWNAFTDPNSQWWGQERSGLEITGIATYPNSSVVTFLWDPYVVPTLDIINPPAGSVVGGNYVLAYEAFDHFAGTTIELYYDDDDADYDGVMIPPAVDKTTPGIEQETHLVPLAFMPDGVYHFYAHMYPGVGEDGRWEPMSWRPAEPARRAGRPTTSAVDG